MSDLRPNLELHIDRLVLDGVGTTDRVALGAAVQAELTRLVVQGGLPPTLANGGHAPHIEGGRISVASGAPTALGAQIAQSVYRGLQS